jgi:hypothetical protein
MNADTAKCFNHRERTGPVRSCHVCNRIGIEIDVVTRTVDALLAAGWALATYDGEEQRPAVPTTDRAVILAELMEVDDEFLLAYKPRQNWDLPVGKSSAFVRFVYGNDGWDVINDYSVSLDPELEAVNTYADSLS